MDYRAILKQAHEAATAAIRAKFDAGEEEQPFNCGFAWVVVPGTSALAKFCRSQDAQTIREEGLYGSKAHPTGWQWWAPGKWPSSADVGRQVYSQDMSFNYAGAKAFAEALNTAIPGLNAAAKQRLD